MTEVIDWLKESRRKQLKWFRGWDVTWLPGYDDDGVTYCATFAIQKRRRWYRVRLDYGELDNRRFYESFGDALKRAGPMPDHLWEKHRDSFPRHAMMNWGGWQWWFGKGLSEAFVEDLKPIVIDHYANARELFKTYVAGEFGYMVHPDCKSLQSVETGVE